MALFSKRAENGAQVDFDHLPRHIAIIMDGHGRWAQTRGLPPPARPPLPSTGDGRPPTAPHTPSGGRKGGEETPRRKPAYHNGTGWTLPFPLYAEALWLTHPEEPIRAEAYALLASAEHLVNQDCVTQLPECVMGDAPHEPCGTGAQAWGVSELFRVLCLGAPPPAEPTERV